MNLNKPVAPPPVPTPPSMFPNQNGSLVEPRAMAASAGWDWISDAWQIFKSNMGLWIITAIVILVISIVMGLIPVIGTFAGVLNVFFVAGVAYMAHKTVNNQPVNVGDVFVGFQQNALQIALVFVLGVVAMIAILLVMGLLAGILGVGFGSLMGENASIMMMLLLLLVGLALIIPISMAMWFAPILALLNNMPAIDAMKLSFKGCLRNILPFFVFSLIMLVLTLVAMIPIGLGLLITIPVAMIATYTAYRQIFTQS